MKRVTTTQDCPPDHIILRKRVKESREERLLMIIGTAFRSVHSSEAAHEPASGIEGRGSRVGAAA